MRQDGHGDDQRLLGAHGVGQRYCTMACVATALSLVAVVQINLTRNHSLALLLVDLSIAEEFDCRQR